MLRNEVVEPFDQACEASADQNLLRPGYHVTAAIHATPPVRRIAQLSGHSSLTPITAVWNSERAGAATEPSAGGCGLRPQAAAVFRFLRLSGLLRSR